MSAVAFLRDPIPSSPHKAADGIRGLMTRHYTSRSINAMAWAR